MRCCLYLQTFHWNVCKGLLEKKVSQGEAVLFAFPSKSCRFSHPFSPCAGSTAHGVSLSADSDQGRCPWTLPAFLKNCWIKKLHCRLRRLFRFRGCCFCCFQLLRLNKRCPYGCLGQNIEHLFSVADQVKFLIGLDPRRFQQHS